MQKRPKHSGKPLMAEWRKGQPAGPTVIIHSLHKTPSGLFTRVSTPPPPPPPPPPEKSTTSSSNNNKTNNKNENPVSFRSLQLFKLGCQLHPFPCQPALRWQQPSVFVNPIVHDPAVSMDRGPGHLDLPCVAPLGLPCVVEDGWLAAPPARPVVSGRLEQHQLVQHVARPELLAVQFKPAEKLQSMRETTRERETK